jgi:membrane fusion protein, heavy metal efflux system
MQLENDIQREPPRARGKRRRLWRGVGVSILALSCLALGAAGSALFFHYTKETPPSQVTTAPTPHPPQPVQNAPETSHEVMLTPEAITQAGIKTAPVTTVDASTAIQVPGSVTANSYREVKVTPIAGGIVTKVHAELGTAVKRGAPLATLVSTELSEVQMKYLSMRAMLEADAKKQERTKQLVEIGAASRQELEEVLATHESHATEVQAARERLLLLGLTREQVAALKSPQQIRSDIIVPAPIAGVVTERSANLGQVVSMGQELFVVTDLSEVWVIGDLYEQDFQHVRVGAEATLTTPAYPGMTFRGRVTYIDPRVELQTRTAKVRVEVPNPEHRLKLGMFVTMIFTAQKGERLVVVPRTAVQTIGARQVVFVPVAEDEGRFVQRVVTLGSMVGDAYTVQSGLAPGELVVTEGSFFLRAELLRNTPASS